ncbi:hypothetical protein BAUCODRAFT_62407 [Baudoinia panamericana UAMH 10762]|uniref:BZIP domain-containing protein n=1 Tax=Baudoinia panamericana (strain UAMH 10762) TaxID=717646 RepID=M2MVX8_BAUPA|nr:uncharacterized protein BAUCODRAFT_62407 [Baudoinia panamericana UAMH 10762]EMD01137.1 hypothetical protein BAUCODRAFT_62407 [Baudoinia panamericana UAMH 10762]
MEGDLAAPSKTELDAVHEGTPSSIDSTPEHETHAELSASLEPTAQPQKRKGGRKPIYATSEERKQRNRQAQAAFRERRTEYIKQLEATIKQNEDTLATLQQSHRSAADECLMLRYKNSLLERILLEKGIDVQAELQLKTGSPILEHGFAPPRANPPPTQVPLPPLQRTAVQRQHARKSGGQTFLPKLAPGHLNAETTFTQPSPQGHPTPLSHSPSPSSLTSRSPLTYHQGGITPPTSTVLTQGQTQQFHHLQARSSQQPPSTGFYQPQQQQVPSNRQRAPQRPPPPSQYQSSASVIAGPSSASAYYPSPFQKHIDQLGNTEQEYDTEQAQPMLDQADHEPEPTSDPSPTQLHGTYPAQYDQQMQHQHAASGQEYYQPGYEAQFHNMTQLQQQQHPGSSRIAPTSQPESSGFASGRMVMGQLIDAHDPLLDADPFGLSASMHYPTTYGTIGQQPPGR